jgi:hypothetical protein
MSGFGSISDIGRPAHPVTEDDRHWIAGLDPAAMTGTEAGRLRALRDRMPMSRRGPADALLARYREAHPRTVEQRPEPQSVANGAKRGREEREAVTAAKQAERDALFAGLQVLGSEGQ